MIAGVGFATTGRQVTVHPRLFEAAQALVGCLIAKSIDPSVGPTILADWPLFLAITLTTIIASGVLGYALSRWRVVPGTVAIWGSTPGAATAMVLMAQAYGADVRLVAVMIYTRVIAVTLCASLMMLAFSGHLVAHRGMFAGALDVDAVQLGVTAAISITGIFLGRLLRLPTSALLGPMILGALLHLAGIVRVDPPHALLMLGYIVVGWRIGLGFTRDSVAAAARAFPRIVIAMLLLIGFCGGLALLLARQLGIDPVTAYLATSPGGLDSVAIIAGSGGADLPFIMALQLCRFVLVMLIGPSLASALARREQRQAESSPD